MTTTDICSVDIAGLSKTNLKALVKVARAEWGSPIDLRSASEGAMCDYLRLYRQWKLDQEAAEEPAVTTSPEASLKVCDLPERIEPSEEQDDVIGGTAASVTDAIFEAEATISEAGSLTIIALVEEAVIPDPEVTEPEITALAALDDPWLTGGGSRSPEYNMPYSEFLDYDTECASEFQPDPQPSVSSTPDKPAPTEQPVIIGLVLLTAIALIADLIANATVWAFGKVRDTQLLQKGCKAAAALVQRHRPQPQGFARA